MVGAPQIAVYHGFWCASYHPDMIRNRVVLRGMLALLPILLLAGCGGESAPGEATKAGDGEFRRVTPEELSTMLESKDFPLVNVHIPYEGEIAETDSFIAFDTIADHLDELPSDKSARVVLYCQTGRMSTEAAGVLVSLGYTDVWELGGGMVAWDEAGLPLLLTRR